jgi:hypothetical protein
MNSYVAPDPFRPLSLTIEYVDSAAGSYKTHTAIARASDDAQRGVKTIIAMPTLDLVAEMVQFARSRSNIPAFEITSANRESRSRPIEQEICRHVRTARDGHLLFITHEAFFRVVDWPPQAAFYELVIDEAPDVILTRRPFVLRYSYRVLTSFLTVRALAATAAEREHKAEIPEFTAKEAELLRKLEFFLVPGAASEGERAQAAAQVKRLRAKRDAWEAFQDVDADTSTYYQVIEGPAHDPAKAQAGLKRRVRGQQFDDIYKYLDPVPRWLLQKNYLFTNRQAWDRMVDWQHGAHSWHQRGMVTITGFRRPDVLRSFARVTVMSALFRHTMLYAVWQTLGVRFTPSLRIDLHVTTTPLGSRKLRIYWLYDQGWSKLTRDRSGGIAKILELIKDADVIDLNTPVCVSLNKDDISQEHPHLVSDIFPNAIVMPHNVRGQNRWRQYHQLVHCAAFNAYTSDIRWIEAALGIDAAEQRIARVGQEVYQTALRLSLREPSSPHDVQVVVVDKDVAEWLAQWFEPRDQVEVIEIDSSEVIRRKGRTGRPPIGRRAMSNAERQRRFRLRHQ